MRKIVIDPRVIKHLGRDLITSPEVAVIELIKNSIDAFGGRLYVPFKKQGC